MLNVDRPRDSRVRIVSVTGSADVGMHAALIMSPVHGGVEDANAAACELFGLSLDELIRSDRHALQDPHDDRWCLALAERAHAGAWQGELSWRRGDGSTFLAAVSTAVISAEGHRHTVVMLRDLSKPVVGHQDSEPEPGLLAQTQALRSRLIALAATHLGGDLKRCPEPEVRARMRRMAVALETAEDARAYALEGTGEYDAAELARQSATDCRAFLARIDKVPD